MTEHTTEIMGTEEFKAIWSNVKSQVLIQLWTRDYELIIINLARMPATTTKDLIRIMPSL
jgi:hypothetical protein